MIPSALHTTALAATEALINRALQFDLATQQRLADLDGKIIQINMTAPNLTIVMICRGQQVSLHAETDQPANVVITGSSMDLVQMALTDEVAVAGSGVEIRGSLDTLQKLKAVLSDLDIDWQAALAKLVGDMPAYIIAHAARKAHTWQRDAQARAKDTTANFIVHEARLTPAAIEMERFQSEVRHLATDVDRLSARIQRIQQQLNQRSDQQDQSS